MDAAVAPRALGVVSLLSRAWASYRARFALYLGATAVVQFPTGLLTWLVGYGASASLDAVLASTLPEVHESWEAIAALLALGADRLIGFGLLLIVAAVVQVIGTVLSAGALAYLLAADVGANAPPLASRSRAAVDPEGPDHLPGRRKHDDPPSISAAYRAVAARLGPLFGAILLAGVILGAVLLAVFVIWMVLYAAQYMLAPAGEAPPGWLSTLLTLALFALIGGALGYAVYAFVRWALFIQAVVLEDAGPADALRRSAALLRGRWWHTALLLTVLAVLQGALGSAASSLLASLLGGQTNASAAALVSGLGLLTANLVFFPLTANALTLLYLGLRAREWEQPLVTPMK